MKRESRFRAAALEALLTERTLEAAAAKAGVSVTTLWRWRQEEGFQAEVKAGQRRAMEQSIGELQCATAAAVASLREIVEAPLKQVGPVTRLMASRCILELAAKFRETEEIEGRLAALEAVATRTGTGGPRRVK